MAESKSWCEFHRTVERGQSELSYRALSESRVEERVSEAGLHLGPVITAEVDDELYDSISFTVRGLPTYHRGESVNPDAEIRVGLLEGNAPERILSEMVGCGGIDGPYHRGGDICSWACQYQDANHSIWLICCYGLLFFLAPVQPARFI